MSVTWNDIAWPLIGRLTSPRLCKLCLRLWGRQGSSVTDVHSLSRHAQWRSREDSHGDLVSHQKTRSRFQVTSVSCYLSASDISYQVNREQVENNWEDQVHAKSGDRCISVGLWRQPQVCCVESAGMSRLLSSWWTQQEWLVWREGMSSIILKYKAFASSHAHILSWTQPQTRWHTCYIYFSSFLPFCLPTILLPFTCIFFIYIHTLALPLSLCISVSLFSVFLVNFDTNNARCWFMYMFSVLLNTWAVVFTDNIRWSRLQWTLSKRLWTP